MAQTAYFKKIVLTTSLRLSNGKPVNWVNAGWNVGVLETSDELTITELTKYAEEQKGGVTVIDKATYDDLKKNSVSKSPRQEWSPGVTSTLEQLQNLSPKTASEKPSKSAAAGKKSVERTEKPATATGVFPPDSSV